MYAKVVLDSTNAQLTWHPAPIGVARRGTCAVRGLCLPRGSSVKYHTHRLPDGSEIVVGYTATYGPINGTK